jgi:hypothetical protein
MGVPVVLTSRRILPLAVLTTGAVVAALVLAGAFSTGPPRRNHAGAPTPGVHSSATASTPGRLPSGRPGTGTHPSTGGTAASVSGGSPTTASIGSPPPNAPVVGNAIKPVIRGLIDRQGAPAKQELSAVHAYVVKVKWADLQPSAFGPIAANNVIDQAIARVRQPDYASLGMALKLRVVAGIGAPDWVKSMGGPPVPYIDNQAGASVAGGTIGRFWTAGFGRAYTDLENKLAARYDLVPEIREITLSRCSTIFDEPFVRQFGDKRNVAALLAAGYTTAADEQCIADSIVEHNVWRHTTTDVDFSPFPLIADPGGPRDLAFTESVMTACRSILGVRCGLQNNSLSTDKLADATFQHLYHRMTELGPTIVLQTATRGRIGDVATVLAAAVTIGANAVELPAGYQSWSLPMLVTTNRDLAANPTG